jgi:hypothetical protein
MDFITAYIYEQYRRDMPSYELPDMPPSIWDALKPRLDPDKVIIIDSTARGSDDFYDRFMEQSARGRVFMNTPVIHHDE